jgi:glutathione S-transferase
MCVRSCGFATSWAYRLNERIGAGYQPTSDARFLELNPFGLIPAVIDEGVVLRESNTIVRYLAAKHGPEELYPRELIARARVEQWMDWANYETSLYDRGRSNRARGQPAVLLELRTAGVSCRCSVL